MKGVCGFLFATGWLMISPLAANAQDGLEQRPAPADQHAHPVPAEGEMQSRQSSGTAWLPQLSPMYGAHRDAGPWALMLHGNAFGYALYEAGEIHRRSKQAGSINWLMGMASRPIGTARLNVRAMVSLEPWTVSGCGYPNLLATGEICRGDTIHDRQHPHDLFMELAASYDRPLAGSLRWQVYGGPAGEPALGPPGFPHRLSAFPNPIAPISHHWLDSTHITFGVVTGAVYTNRLKAEASVFNGREPDPTRTDLDFNALDSTSARLAFAPTPGLALQVSAGHLRDAEAGLGSLQPTTVDRATASGIYHRRTGNEGLWATTLAYGVNSETDAIPGGFVDQTTHAMLLETSVSDGRRSTWFGRFELVGKPAHDLHAHEYITLVFIVGKIQGGYVRHFKTWKGLVPGVGATMDASLVPRLLAPRYGGRITPGFGVFVTVRPVQRPM